MASHAAEELVGLLSEEAGEYLRSVAHYDSGEFEMLYMREDVDLAYSEEDLEAVFDYWRKERLLHDSNPFQIGNRHCTVGLFDDALAFHFSQGDRVGTVVALDPEAGRDLLGFVTHCLEQLYRSSPQAIENAPHWLDP